MQSLYTIDSLQNELKPGEATKILQTKIDQSHKLFTYLIYFATEVAKYAEKDAIKRASKHLPTEADLSVNTRIASNTVLWEILDNRGFAAAVDNMHLSSIMDEGLLREMYLTLVQTNEYKDYITEEKRIKKSERHILEFIFNDLMLPSEKFISHVEENFLNWDDDAEMMHALVISFFKHLPKDAFYSIIDKEKKDFATELLHTVRDKADHFLEIIKPKLNNWDADRIAALDMILLQMGVAEFLYFETIPPKVSINEYIDMAKAYSTPQSGQFVNGVLDSIHKDLLKENKISKKEFKH